MPYSTPSATTMAAPRTMSDAAPAGRPTHRRSYTSERGPGAFASLGALPRRTPAHFHFPSDHSSSNSSESDDDDSHRPPPPIKFRLHLNTSPVPFPRTSPTPSPLPSPRIQSAPRPTPSRTSSSPILLSNGKPLKSSLKGSSSSPNIVGLPHHQSMHLRARSAPSTPAPELLSPTGSDYSDQSVTTPKNVHFPDHHLETVRVFNRSAKPASLLSVEDTETESEVVPSQGFPFPVITPPAYSIQSDPIPGPSSPGRSVILESIRLDKLTLKGSLLVRNVAFEKQVFVRFTLDDWLTTSEVAGHYAASLPANLSPLTVGDVAAGVVPDAWDRFDYTIRLEDYAPSLAARTMYIVLRYASGGGEWWDNNSGRNYRVQFTKSSSPPPITSTVPFPTVVETPATPPQTPPTPPVHERVSSAESFEKRVRGLRLANYAKPNTPPALAPPVLTTPAGRPSSPLSQQPMSIPEPAPDSPVTPALSHSDSDGSESEDEVPSPAVERPRRIANAKVPTPAPPMLKTPPPPRRGTSSPLMGGSPTTTPLGSPSLGLGRSPGSPSPSPPSSSDDLYKAFVQKWCFVGGVGA